MDWHEQVNSHPVHSEYYHGVVGIGPKEYPDKLGGQLHPECHHTQALSSMLVA